TLNHLRFGLVVFLHVLVITSSQANTCPEKCVCSISERTTIAKCVNNGLSAIPYPLPANVKTLFITGNNISHLTGDSFQQTLEQLTYLNLSGNKIEQIDPKVFTNMPRLGQLDLSNNRIFRFSAEAFSADNVLQQLNLSSSIFNSSYIEEISNVLRIGTFLNLTTLELSYNDLVYLPEGMFSNLPNLKNLDLRNNSIVSVKRGALKNQRLENLDLRENSLKELSNDTLNELDLHPDIKILLAGNSWLCNCNIEDFLLWLQKSESVLDKQDLVCAFPENLRNTRLLQMNASELQCTFSEDMKGVLQTSYVFLGIVLALIGVIFLLVLYLNRKGIKKWLYNIRDACRDHMEGYHYRYEINTDPRLTNLSLNSEV
uniref:Trophoblast glycoprotein n=2 Tax=Lepisosteus oculatus TaxID=7918 RepID=W5NMW7_LEPOC